MLKNGNYQTRIAWQRDHELGVGAKITGDLASITEVVSHKSPSYLSLLFPSIYTDLW